jgi:hypothetical protein
LMGCRPRSQACSAQNSSLSGFLSLLRLCYNANGGQLR